MGKLLLFNFCSASEATIEQELVGSEEASRTMNSLGCEYCSEAGQRGNKSYIDQFEHH